MLPDVTLDVLVSKGVVAVLAANLPQRSHAVDVARGLTGGHQEGGCEALFISAVEGGELSSSCSGSSGGGSGGGEVGAEHPLTVDEDVGEGARLAGVADKTAGRHYRVGERVVIVVVVVVVLVVVLAVVVVKEWMKHFDLAVCDGMSFVKIRVRCERRSETELMAGDDEFL